METKNEELERNLTFDDQVIAKIAGITASQVPGIISLDGNMLSEFTDKLTQGNDQTKGIEAQVGEKQVALKLAVTLEYGKSAETVFTEVSDKLTQALGEMTGLKLVKFEMHINDVKTREELKENK
ncbi:Asp23/Gls24 family envelope stress response protein [Ligilactobacillus apodemi]|uniref:Asp23/Gls24 family envelope stress response protein n=1 Tax=Ligilactobacillus apodemi TaxID=307126 RepID=UPI0019BF375C|nr:Asp23/Gls24 family envelope stress response protein [Ligilactobacillus apodemi]MBD5069748.1 Asp23/Gls24 family envelope stress response protein [Lactobacillus sp.]MCR1901528.1 Asp23/Gls24 family envelope stress response protein [Ligilactobacillus apodemi]